MNRAIRKIRNQTMELFASIPFAAGVILFFFTCMISMVYYNDGLMPKSSTIVELVFSSQWKQIMYTTTAFSSDMIIYNFRGSSWFSMLAILAFSFPAVTDFLAEYNSGNYYFTAGRLSIRSYGLRKMLSSGLAGMGVFVCGYVLFIGVVSAVFPSVSEYSSDLIADYESFYHRIDAGYLLSTMLHMCVIAFLTACVVLCLSLWIRDVYLVFGLPMLVCYLIDKMMYRIGDLYPQIYGNGCGWWKLLVPSEYMILNQSFQSSLNLPIGLLPIFLGLETALIVGIFIMKLRRRIQKND